MVEPTRAQQFLLSPHSDGQRGILLTIHLLVGMLVFSALLDTLHFPGKIGSRERCWNRLPTATVWKAVELWPVSKRKLFKCSIFWFSDKVFNHHPLFAFSRELIGFHSIWSQLWILLLTFVDLFRNWSDWLSVSFSFHLAFSWWDRLGGYGTYTRSPSSLGIDEGPWFPLYGITLLEQIKSMCGPETKLYLPFTLCTVHWTNDYQTGF